MNGINEQHRGCQALEPERHDPLGLVPGSPGWRGCEGQAWDRLVVGMSADRAMWTLPRDTAGHRMRVQHATAHGETQRERAQ